MAAGPGAASFAVAVALRQTLVQTIRQRLPEAFGIWAFGSRLTGHAGPHSDLDLAVLVPGYADAVQLFALAGDLASPAGCDVDLLDLRAASTVMQHQVVSTGERWWAADDQAVRYEIFILREKLNFDAARAGLLADIAQRGSIHGR